MKKFYSVVLLAFVLIITISCVLPSCPKPGVRGIVDTRHLKDNIYFISIEGNDFTSRDEADKYFNQKVSEFCVQTGFPDYKVISATPVKCSQSVYLFIYLLPISGPQFDHLLGESGYVECLRKE